MTGRVKELLPAKKKPAFGSFSMVFGKKLLVVLLFIKSNLK